MTFFIKCYNKIIGIREVEWRYREHFQLKGDVVMTVSGQVIYGGPLPEFTQESIHIEKRTLYSRFAEAANLTEVNLKELNEILSSYHSQ